MVAYFLLVAGDGERNFGVADLLFVCFSVLVVLSDMGVFWTGVFRIAIVLFSFKFGIIIDDRQGDLSPK